MTDNLTPEKRFLSWPIYIFLGLGLLAMVQYFEKQANVEIKRPALM